MTYTGSGGKTHHASSLFGGSGLALKMAVVAGGSAGNFTVTGIKANSVLVGVAYFTKSTNLTAVTDLTSEFTVTAANTINNTGGTATTDGYLQVFYQDLVE